MAVAMANIQISIDQFFALFALMSINAKTIMGIANQSRVSFLGFLGLWSWRRHYLEVR
jgi:hypothetical protein